MLTLIIIIRLLNEWVTGNCKGRNPSPGQGQDQGQEEPRIEEGAGIEREVRGSVIYLEKRWIPRSKRESN